MYASIPHSVSLAISSGVSVAIRSQSYSDFQQVSATGLRVYRQV